MRYLVEMHPVGDHERVGHQRLGGKHRRYVVVRIIVHHVIGGDEHRQVASRLLRQIIVDGPEIEVFGVAAGTAQRFVDGAGTAVVGGDGERPVAVGGEEVLEVLRGFGRGGVWIAALVDKRRHFQAHPLGRAYHELPQPRGSMLGDGVRVEPRFDHRQIFQLEREAVLFECLFEYGHVVQVESEQRGNLCAAALRVPVDVAAYDLVVRHLDERGELGETFADGGVIGLHVSLTLIAVVGGRIVFHVPALEHLPGVGLVALGENYAAVGDFSLYVEHVFSFVCICCRGCQGQEQECCLSKSSCHDTV